MPDLNPGASSPERGAGGTPALLPCPFCGNDAAEETIIDKNEGVAYTPWYQAVCTRCDFWLPGSRDEAEAIAQWNRRASVVPAGDAPADGKSAEAEINEVHTLLDGFNVGGEVGDTLADRITILRDDYARALAAARAAWDAPADERLRRFGAASDEVRLRKLEDTLYTYLGFREPEKLIAWIVDARAQLTAARADREDAERLRYALEVAKAQCQSICDDGGSPFAVHCANLALRAITAARRSQRGEPNG